MNEATFIWENDIKFIIYFDCMWTIKGTRGMTLFHLSRRSAKIWL